MDLEKIKSFKEMISLNSAKAVIFCADWLPMIQYVEVERTTYFLIRLIIGSRFNQGHFTRIYPDLSRRSWDSSNYDPTYFWTIGCQMVALNFQMPGSN